MKKKTNYSVFIWLLVGIMYMIVLPVLQEFRINQLSREVAIMQDLIVRTNKNETVLDNKLNTLHDQLQNMPSIQYCYGRDCSFGQPQDNSTQQDYGQIN